MTKTDTLRFGSVCSGIEAASVAWEPLGWKASWLAEIEPFPSAVLAHHYPDVPNLGDMTTIAGRILSGEVEAPDVLVGGTPCQAFSVAGLRKGLSDNRGQLTLSFVELANAIDIVRQQHREPESIIIWENVPGVFSTKDNAFGCFLGALAGEDSELQPPGGKWKNAGAVFGPKRAIAWRVLDAQYFGVAQRRRRVFVVASAREGFDPTKILFEFEGMRRDTAPSRETGQKVAPTVVQSPPYSRTGNERVECDAILPVTCMAHGQGGAEIADNRSPTLTCNHEAPIVAFSCKDYGADAGLVSPTLRAMNHGESHANAGGQVAVAFGIPGNWIGRSPENGGNSTEFPRELSPCLTSTDKHGVIAFDSRQDPVSSDRVFGALGSSSPQAVAVSLRGREGGATAELGDEVGNCLRASSGGGDKPYVLAPAIALQTDATPKASEELAFTLKLPSASGGGQPAACMTPQMAVRRLTPKECERLQGFPDDYTLVPVRGKAAADGPRYKALGNSWAVPVARWIGERIQQMENKS